MDDNSQQPQEQQSKQPSVDSVVILSLLWSRRKFILLATLCGVALTIGYSFVVPHKYKSYAKIIASDSKASSLATMMSGLPSFITSGSGSTSIPVMTVGEILASKTNAQYVINKCGLKEIDPFKSLNADEQIDAVMTAISSDPKRSSGVILLECELKTSYFPTADEGKFVSKLSADMCNAAIEGLDKTNREKNVSTARKTRMYIERVLASNKLKIDSMQNIMVEYQKKHKLLSPENQATAVITNAVGVGTELAKAEVELRLAKEQYQNNTPLIQSLEQKVRTLQEQFSRSQTGGISSSDEVSIPVTQLPGITRDYLNMVRDLKILEQVNAYLETQRMQESIQEERDTPTIQVVDAATPPIKRSSPSRTMMTLLGIIASFVVACGIVLMRTVVKAWWQSKKAEAAGTLPSA